MKRALAGILASSLLINAIAVIYKFWNDPIDLIKIVLLFSTIVVILIGLFMMLAFICEKE